MNKKLFIVLAGAFYLGAGFGLYLVSRKLQTPFTAVDVLTWPKSISNLGLAVAQ